jgi:hypothetical protein
VTEYSDGTVALKFAPAAVLARPVEEPRGTMAPVTRPARPGREKDAVEIAINGIDYNPDEVADLAATEGDA